MGKSKPNEPGSFLFFRSFYETVKELNERDRNRALNQIIEYAFDGTIPDNSDSALLRLFAINWMPLIDADLRRQKGGAPKGNQNAKGNGAPNGNKNASKKTNNQTNNKQTTNQTTNKQPSNNNNDNDNDINNDIDIDIVADKSATGLTPLSSLGEDRASALEGGMNENENDDDWVFDPEVAEREYQEWKKQNGIV